MPKKSNCLERRKEEYHNWFLIHSGIKANQIRKEVLSNIEKSEEEFDEYNNELSKVKIDINDYSAWFEKHSVKAVNTKLGKSKEEIFNELYTFICKKNYPLVLKPIHKMKDNICVNHFKIFKIYCLTCENHYCIECETNHIGHSIIKFNIFSFQSSLSFTSFIISFIILTIFSSYPSSCNKI